MLVYWRHLACKTGSLGIVAYFDSGVYQNVLEAGRNKRPFNSTVHDWGQHATLQLE